MDLAFNDVNLSSEELKSASPQSLKSASELSNPQKFKIDVPQVPEEFPNQSSKKSQMYSLPLSIENQCKTLGMGRNLDSFTDEFGFVTKKENIFLPLKKSKKEFNLDLAYKRFAFLKSMEVHKKGQHEYEKYLRQSQVESGSDDDDVVFLPMPDEDNQEDDEFEDDR